MDESLALSFTEIVSEICNAIELANLSDMFFFGHSMGSQCAFSAYGELKRRGAEVLPQGIVVSAALPPREFFHDMAERTRRCPNDLRDDFRRLSGIPTELADSADYERLFLSPYLSDCNACAAHTTRDVELLDIPMLVIGGDADDDVPAERLLRWKQYCNHTHHHCQTFPGGHSYLKDNWERVSSLMQRFFAFPQP